MGQPLSFLLPLLLSPCLIHASSSLLGEALPAGVMQALKDGSMRLSELEPYRQDAPFKWAANEALHGGLFQALDEGSNAHGLAVLRDVLKEMAFGVVERPAILSTVAASCRTDALQVLAQAWPDLDVMQGSGMVFNGALRSGVMVTPGGYTARQCKASLAWLMAHSSYDASRESIEERKAGMITWGLRQNRYSTGANLGQLKNRAAALCKFWGVTHLDYTPILNAMIVATPRGEPATQEKMLASALLDRHGYLLRSPVEDFGGDEGSRADLLGYVPKPGDPIVAKLFTPSEAALLDGAQGCIRHLQGQIRTVAGFLERQSKAEAMTEGPKRKAALAQIQREAAVAAKAYLESTANHEEPIPMALGGLHHASVATYKRDPQSPKVGTYTIFNTGDGTVEYDEAGRTALFERFEGVAETFIEEILVHSMTRPFRHELPFGTTFRDIFYPSSFTRATRSSQSIKGQRTGSCSFRSLYAFLLHRLGGDRTVYLKTKIAMTLAMLRQLYGALAQGYRTHSKDPSHPIRITLAGATFEVKNLPIWIYVWQSGTVERKLLRQVFRHSGALDPQTFVDACTEAIRDHSRTARIQNWESWPEWNANGLWTSWIELPKGPAFAPVDVPEAPATSQGQAEAENVDLERVMNQLKAGEKRFSNGLLSVTVRRLKRFIGKVF